ncbi:MAG: hypothetical protein QQW96_23445 [Tychonema bourrellyi B0820]|uniref:hypothetical protein n=1 Tax=Tychonema bourrellyi TaxID=54313 RepID=UPI001FEB5059|nr:hypothetical protein [Tychonema bourrellyi]MDQ2100587.1 hypothetical protein [Tychonema bourrellyi B0820]
MPVPLNRQDACSTLSKEGENLHSEEIPTQEIIDKLRQALEPRMGIAEPLLSGSEKRAIAFDEEDEDIALLKTGFDIYNVPITSYQRRLGSVVIAVRKIVRKLLKPVLERQVIYNFANTRVVQTLSNQLQKLQQNQQTLEKKIKSEFSNQSPEVTAKIMVQQAAITALQSEIEQIKAVQQQHTAMLEEITAQLFDRSQ